MTDEQLPEMMELIGPEAAKDVRVLAYVFNGARDQEEFFKYSALENEVNEIGKCTVREAICARS